MKFYCNFFLFLFLFAFINTAFGDFLPSENNVRELKKNDYYNDVMKLVGPPKEKIVKKTKQGATWVYNNFELHFRNRRLVKAVKLFDRVVLDESLVDESERTKKLKAKEKKKVKNNENLLQGIFGSGK